MKSLVKLAVAAAVALAALPASAQYTANLNVRAQVVKNCVVTTTDLDFGSYDPVVANSAAPQPGSGAVHVACTRTSAGETFSVQLDQGQNFSGTRRMTNGTDFLPYDVLDASNAAWPAGGVNGTPGGIVPVDVIVNGSIPAAQDVSAGAYSDTVVVTVTY